MPAKEKKDSNGNEARRAQHCSIRTRRYSRTRSYTHKRTRELYKLNPERCQHIPWPKSEMIILSPWVCLSAIDEPPTERNCLCFGTSLVQWFSCYWRHVCVDVWHRTQIPPRGLGTAHFKHLGKHSTSLETTCECCVQVLGAAFKMNSCDWTGINPPSQIPSNPQRNWKDFNYSP